MAKGRKGDSDDDLDFEEALLSVTEKRSSSKRKNDSDDDSDYEPSSKRESSKKKKSSSSSSSSSSRRSSSSSSKKKEQEDIDSMDEFSDGYDEDLYVDDEERMRMAKLPEIEREDILAARYEKRKQIRERWEQQQSLKKQEKSKSNRSSSSSSSSSSNAASSSRRGTEREKEERALSDMKKKREKAQKSKDEEREREKKREKEDRERDKERDKREREKEAEREREKDIEKEIQKQLLDTDIQTLNQVRLSRNMLVKWVDQPYFETLTPGFLVRVVIGQHMNNPVYRIGEIISVKSGSKVYKVENKETDKLLTLSYAGAHKDFSIENVSNNTITVSEQEKWITDMVRNNQKLPTKDTIQKKIGDIKKAADYVYTNEDIEKRAQERMKYNRQPVNIAFEKAKLTQLRDTLEPKSAQWNAINEQIEEYIKMGAEIKAKKQEEDPMLKINQKNKTFNFKQQHSQTMESTVSNEMDPFARRRTRAAATVAGVSNQEVITPQKDQNNNNQNNTQNQNNSPSTIRKLHNQDQNQTLQEIHNSIELNIYIPDNLNKILSSVPMKKKRPVKSFNDNYVDHSQYKNVMSTDEYLSQMKSH